MRATRAIIHLENLRFNIEEIQKKTGSNVRICVPVKADGYGHGATKVAIAAIQAGATYLAVASVQEGIDLREAGIVTPILSLSLPIPEEIPQIAEYGLTPLVADCDFIAELGTVARSLGKKVAVYLKIDTGMGRIGCSPDEAGEVARRIVHEKNLILEGCITHLSVSDSVDSGDIAYTKHQIAEFRRGVELIRAEGIDPGILSAASSGAILQYPEAHFDMIRPGILVYGYPPSEELAGTIELKPVMEVESQIVYIKKVPEGTAVSYGRTWTAERDTYIATLPIGYADGLPRRLSPGFSVRAGGENWPVIGRICMDQCMIDLGPNPKLKRWDRVTIFGPDPEGANADTLAKKIGTISYEITSGINKRVPRVYVGDDVRNRVMR
jgi:alanine racemase